MPRSTRTTLLLGALLVACSGAPRLVHASDLLWCPVEVSAGPVASDLALREALIERGRVVVRCDSLSSFVLENYDAVWVCLGVFPFTHPLTFDEGRRLRDYVASGGTLYIEGGDIWGYDILTPLNAIDGIAASADGGSDLVRVVGQETPFGLDLTDLDAPYTGENSHLDHLHADEPGASLLFSSSETGYGIGVLHEGARSGLADFRVLGCSFEFGGWTGERDALMEGILIALGLIPDCRGIEPTAPRCILRPQGVEISWAITAPFTEIEVRRDGATIAALPPTVTEYFDLTPPGGLHEYAIFVESGGACSALSPATAIDVPQPERFRRGDVDGDGGENIVDAIELLRSLFVANHPLPCPDSGDINDNGALDITDAIALLRHLFESAAPPAPPFGACGSDPTVDALSACAEACSP